MDTLSHTFKHPIHFIIEPAVQDDCPALYELALQAAGSVPHPSWFCMDSLDFIRRHVGGCGFILKASACPEPFPAAFLLVRFPGPDEDNLGRSLGLSASRLLHVAHMETVVVSRDFTGHGLQRALLREGEARAAAMGFRYLMATVHPDNLYSLKNFEQLGYRKIEEAVKYGGLPRWILGKSVQPSV